MKKFFLLLLVFAFSTDFAQGQIIKMRTTYASHKIGNQDWTEWVDFKTLAIINTQKSNLTIYGEPREVYEIIDKNETNGKDGIIFSVNCIDKEGEECKIEIQVDDIKKTNIIYITYPNALMAIVFDKA